MPFILVLFKDGLNSFEGFVKKNHFLLTKKILNSLTLFANLAESPCESAFILGIEWGYFVGMFSP